MIKILVCDDDKAITEEVSAFLKEQGLAINLNYDITSITDSTSADRDNCRFDFAVIDIEMPRVNGLELAEILKKNNPDVIILVLTSYLKYIDDAMRVEVFRYLQKPLDKKRLHRNMLDAIRKYREISKNVAVNLHDRIVYINTKDILYLENTKNGSLMYTKTECYKTAKKPAVWLAEFNSPDSFAFCHKSFCVNLRNVISLSRKEVILRKNPVETVALNISQSKYKAFRDAFMAFIGGQQ